MTKSCILQKLGHGSYEVFLCRRPYCYNVIYGYQTFTIPVPFAGRFSLDIKAGAGVVNGHSVTPFTLVTTTTTTTTVRELSCIVELLMLVFK
jgi:hypothetical protein